MNPRIATIAEKKLVGKRMTMSFSDNKTFELWRSFMPRRKEIQNSIGTELYSVQVYDRMDFGNPDLQKEFEKWATVEATDFKTVPSGMETMTLPGGLYAVFPYKGAATAAQKTFQHIFNTWLPNSDFSLDNRPHFEILGKRYKHEDPNSEEDICIPIKPK
jgi:AraC family transcriptional regulator